MFARKLVSKEFTELGYAQNGFLHRVVELCAAVGLVSTGCGKVLHTAAYSSNPRW